MTRNPVRKFSSSHGVSTAALVVITTTLLSSTISLVVSAEQELKQATDFQQCPLIPLMPYFEPIQMTVQVDPLTGTADWVTGNELVWNQVKSEGLVKRLQDATTFQRVYDVTKSLGLDQAVDQVVALANSGITKYGEEYQQIADVLGVDLYSIIVFNYFYESAGQCTSIVANTVLDEEEIVIIHGRNMDFDSMDGALSDLTSQVTFIDGETGDYMYSCTTFVGYVGCLTGMRPGKFSISLNQRYENDSIETEMYVIRVKEIIQHIKEKDFSASTVAYGLFNRQHLFNGTDFAPLSENIVDTGNSGGFVTQAYLTVAGIGPNEGTVFHVPGGISVVEDGETTYKATIGETNFPCHMDEDGGHAGFCLQTNSDSVEALEASGAVEMFRYMGGITNMDNVAQQEEYYTPQNMFDDILAVCPTQVHDFTLFSAVMVPASGYYTSKVAQHSNGSGAEAVDNSWVAGGGESDTVEANDNLDNDVDDISARSSSSANNSFSYGHAALRFGSAKEWCLFLPSVLWLSVGALFCLQ